MTSIRTSSEAAAGAPTGAAGGSLCERLSALEHDMRTPVGTLGTALKVLRMGPRPDPGDALDVADRQIRVLTAHLEQLHDLCRELLAMQAPRR